MNNDDYVRYDYAWKQSGWTVQNPTVIYDFEGTYDDPGLPDDVSKVLVTGEFIDQLTGRPLDGVIQIRTNKLLVYTPDNMQVFPGVKRIRFNNGGFSIMLPATDDPQLSPVDWEYEIRLVVAGYVQETTTLLPASPAEVDIADLFADEEES